MMKRWLALGMVPVLALCLLCGCGPRSGQTPQPVPEQTTGATNPEETVPPVISSPTEETSAPTEASTEIPTEPALSVPGVSIDDVILYFNEVCLNAEFVNSGDPTLLQRWEIPIQYICIGTYTEEDRNTLDSFVSWLNTVEGFPGMQQTQDPDLANLRIHFYDYEDYMALMGDDFAGTDGAVTFWYNGADEIYDAIIAYRTDVDQKVRNSVILEEIYNGLGPINDTDLRPDSVIYSGYSIPQSLSPMDELLLRLLYHPQMQCGMDAGACEAVIRQVYAEYPMGVG